MRRVILAGLFLYVLAELTSAANPVATYQFNDSFAADQPGVPPLTVIDPLGTSGFVTDAAQGRRVWAFNGNIAGNEQAGLTLNTTSFINPENYSIDMIFMFTSRQNLWRRILDVQNRQSDNGFYVSPSNNLYLYPVTGSTATWTNNVYHHVVLTNSGSTVNAYLDGVLQLTVNGTLMNLNFDPVNNPNRLLGFFIDNVVAGGQQEYGTGRIALARLWSGELTPGEAQAPTVVAWRSVRTHTGPGDLSITLNSSASGNGRNGPTVETRQGGIQKIQIDFDQPMTLVNPSAISIIGRPTSGNTLGAPIDYTPQATASIVPPQTLQLAFNPGALPDQTCYFINIGASVQNTNGTPPLGATQSYIRALTGNPTNDGAINLGDTLAIAARAGTAAPLSPAFDLNLSGGVITLADALVAKIRVTSPAIQTLCP